jgi:hypothetical protein
MELCICGLDVDETPRSAPGSREQAGMIGPDSFRGRHTIAIDATRHVLVLTGFRKTLLQAAQHNADLVLRRSIVPDPETNDDAALK